MREIKFSYIAQHGDTGYIMDQRFTMEQIEGCNFIAQWRKKFRRWGIIARREFTGLLDKNGKEIYEGDILTSSTQPKEGDEPTLSVVQWSNTPYTAHFNFGSAPACHLAIVIGNIYENPELLEEEK